MSAKRYIGITGAADIEEVKVIVQEFNKAGYDMNSFHIPMLGFLVTSRSLQYRSESPDSKRKRYPPFNDLEDMLIWVEGKALAMIHYCPGTNLFLKDEIDQMLEGFYSTGLCRAIQLNIDCPNEDAVNHIKSTYSDLLIVFQLRKSMIKKSAKDTVDALNNYYHGPFDEYFDYVLIDPSGGQGTPFDTRKSVKLYKELKDRYPDLIVGFAGGLAGQDCEQRLTKIVDMLGNKDFCIDSESGVRDSKDDTLDTSELEKHLQEVARVL